MRPPRASLISAETASSLTERALDELTRIRAAYEHPALYPMDDHPWTDHFARLIRDEVSVWIESQSDITDIHVVAAHWRAASLLSPGPVRAGEHPLYDVAWRVYPEDGEQLLSQLLVAECVWKGGWPALARGCDRLAQARSVMKLIVTMDDPMSKIGEMSLAEACAFRINAFAPAGDHVTLAFFGSGSEDSWRDEAGFTLFDYVTGEFRLRERDATDTP